MEYEGAYIKFEYRVKKWFNDMLEGMVSNPEALNWARIKGGLDMEIFIRVAEEDKRIFTEEVCLALGTILAAALGKDFFSKPVIYLYGAPHPQAAEPIHYAGSHV